MLEEGGAQVRGPGDFEGSAVCDDGVDDVFVAGSGDVVVVHADVGGFGAFPGVLGAAALVGCGEVFEGFAAGGVVGGVDAQIDAGVGGGFVLLGVPVVDGAVVVGADVVGLCFACGRVAADAGEAEVAPEDGFDGGGLGAGGIGGGALPRRARGLCLLGGRALCGGVLRQRGEVACLAGAAPRVQVEAVTVQGERYRVDDAFRGAGAVGDGEGASAGEGARASCSRGSSGAKSRCFA